jgi:type II secretory pathway pseudopilin PulG
MKKVPLVFVIPVAVLAFAASFLVVRLAMADPINQSKLSSELSLSYLREQIRQYHETTGEFPSSLAQMKARFVGKQGERWGPDREWLSTDKGNERESSVLDGSGGWYYNKETGELKINLNKPLKSYLKHYCRRDRNERPCDW